MEYLFIYLLQLSNVLNDLNMIFTIVCVVLLVVGGFFFLSYLIEQSEYGNTKQREFAKQWWQKLLKYVVIFFIGILVLDFIPTKQTILLLGGVYYGKKAVKQVVTSQKLEKVNTIIDLQLDKYIKDLSKEVK